MEISDLRYDLEQLPDLQRFDLTQIPDAMVVLLHDQYSTMWQEGAPQWLTGLITTWIALEKNAINDYQHHLEEKESIIQELRARLGYDVDVQSDYSEAS